MLFTLSRTASLAGIAVVGAWSGIGFGLGVILSLPTQDAGPASDMPTQRHSWSTTVDLQGIDPCTDELVDIETRLVVDVLRPGTGGHADVEVRLENQRGTPPTEGIDPLVRRFAPYTTPISGTPYVHSLRTPLAGRHGSLDVVVDLQGAIDDRGEVSLSVVDGRIDERRSPCGNSPPGPPSQPVTHRLLPAA